MSSGVVHLSHLVSGAGAEPELGGCGPPRLGLLAYATDGVVTTRAHNLGVVLARHVNAVLVNLECTPKTRSDDGCYVPQFIQIDTDSFHSE